MKKNLIIAALALTLSIGVGTSVYASDTTNEGTNTNKSEVTAPGKVKEKKDFRGAKHIKMEEVLSEKFGITKEELSSARQAGKTLNQLLTEKGIDLKDFRTALIEKHSVAIDEAVANGSITKEKGEEIKAKIKTKIESNNFDKVRPEKDKNFKGHKGPKTQKETNTENNTNQS